MERDPLARAEDRDSSSTTTRHLAESGRVLPQRVGHDDFAVEAAEVYEVVRV